MPLSDADPPLRLLAAFHGGFPSLTPECIVKAPEREIWAAACLTGGEELTLVSGDQTGRAVFTRRTARLKRTVTNRPLPRWARYPAGVLLALIDSGMDVPGMNVAVVGEEPEGPRYDYALGMAFAALWHRLHERPCSAASLIELVDHVRRDYIDT